ncbi:MAG: T9SS type A sorting domain-containing protein [Saprospiraceae bacterium]
MFPKMYLISSLLFLSLNLFSQNTCPETFFQVIGDTTNERGYGVYPAPDGNLYATGLRGDSCLLMKMNTSGQIIWARTFDIFPIVADHLVEILVDSDGMIVGCGNSGEDNTTQSFLFRYDPDNDAMLWVEKGLGLFACYGILEKGPGGNFILYTNPHFQGHDDIKIIEVERNSGGFLPNFQRRYQHESSDAIRSMVYHDGALYGTGRITDGDEFGDMRHSISKFSSTGFEQYTKLGHVPSFQEARLYGMDLIVDGNNLVSAISGDDDDSFIFETDVFLQKTTLDGSLLWVKKYELEDFENAFVQEIIQVPGGYLLYGYNRTGTANYFLIKTDQDGNIDWAQKLDYADEDGFSAFENQQGQIMYADDYIYGAGAVNAFGENADMLFFKIGIDGYTGSNCGFFEPTNVIVSDVGSAVLYDINLTEFPDAGPFEDAVSSAHPAQLQSTSFCKPYILADQNLSICFGDSIEINGLWYASPVTVKDTVASGNGCDTIFTTFLSLTPHPEVDRTLLFCQGDSLVIDGVAYTQPTLVTSWIQTGVGCDTIVHYSLEYANTGLVSVSCPPDFSVEVDASGVVPPIDYDTPLAGNPDWIIDQTNGLPSGSVFPQGITPNCFTATDNCGETAECCFTVTVIQEDGPCDVKEDGCVRFEVIQLFLYPDGSKTYQMRLVNNCPQALQYVLYEVPAGQDADGPANNSIYTAPSGNEYLVRNPNFTPFNSVRFRTQGTGIANGEADIFEYTLAPQAAPQFIHSKVRLEPQIYYEAISNLFYCPVVLVGNRSSHSDYLSVFPNPSSGAMTLESTLFLEEGTEVQVYDLMGRLVFKNQNPPQGVYWQYNFGPELQDGVYTLMVRNGERLLQKRLVIQH